MTELLSAVICAGLLTLATHAEDEVVRRLSLVVAGGLALLAFASWFAGCSPSEPYGPMAARWAVSP